MKIDWRASLGSARGRFDRLSALLRAHRFWVECALLGTLALSAVTSVAASAARRAEALEAERERLDRTGAALQEWVATAIAAQPGESTAWRASEESLRRLDQQSAEPLSVARQVAARAEEVGVRDLRIRLANPDTLSMPLELGAGPWAVQPARAGLVVEFTGTMGNLISFLGALPPQVEVGELAVSAAEADLRIKTTLVLRRLTRRS